MRDAVPPPVRQVYVGRVGRPSGSTLTLSFGPKLGPLGGGWSWGLPRAQHPPAHLPVLTDTLAHPPGLTGRSMQRAQPAPADSLAPADRRWGPKQNKCGVQCGWGRGGGCGLHRPQC